MSGYRTIRQAASEEFVINKSVFIGHAAPVDSEAAALAFIREKREQYRDATHNCYAYTIGANMGIMRYSDDGEPGGTAGLPMMEVIKKQQICSCCVVVTRYFGGILLGAGGLVRAYTQGCAAALKAARPVMMEATCRYLCEVPYSLWDRVTYRAASLPVQLTEVSYTAAVVFTLLVREEDAEEAVTALTQLTNGQMEYLADGVSYQAWEVSDGEQA